MEPWFNEFNVYHSKVSGIRIWCNSKNADLQKLIRDDNLLFEAQTLIEYMFSKLYKFNRRNSPDAPGWRAPGSFPWLIEPIFSEFP